MADQKSEIEKQGDELYEKYGKPLEAEHWGEYLAISPEGQIILGDSFFEVAREAATAFGPGNFLFKVGEIAVGKMR